MSGTVMRAGSDAVTAAVDEARALYAARRPRTSALHERARAFLPGGNTRSVLYHRPFPLRIARAWEAVLEDADGHLAALPSSPIAPLSSPPPPCDPSRRRPLATA